MVTSGCWPRDTSGQAKQRPGGNTLECQDNLGQKAGVAPALGSWKLRRILRLPRQSSRTGGGLVDRMVASGKALAVGTIEVRAGNALR